MYLNNICRHNGTDRISLKTGAARRDDRRATPGSSTSRPDGSGDYRLAAGSPAVDAGVAIGAPATAIDGTPRPQSGGVDIGVYERVTARPVRRASRGRAR